MTAFQNANPETERGRAFFAELLWVHGMLRRDLDTVERLAADVAEGLSAEDLRLELETLKTTGPLWQLKISCVRYCRFVHGHHNLEDVAIFPAIRAVDPELGTVVDRLEADHRRVSDILEQIEDAAAALTEPDADAARGRVVAGLRELHSHLLEHLDYEEESAGPVLRRMDFI